MASISIQTKLIKDMVSASAVGSENDLLIIRFNDGTGSKTISIKALSAFIQRALSIGAVADLSTEDKASLVAAINELVAAKKTDKKEISALKEIIANHNGAGVHNAIYRGKNLGNTLTEAQSSAIRRGTFDGLYIGDYWTIGGVNYRIAAFDYYLNSGDRSCTSHHVVIVPDDRLYTFAMNPTNTTNGGYIGSSMYKEGLKQARSTIKAAFSGHVLKHRIYLTNAVTNGRASAGAWCDFEVELMCEQMVYGNGIFSPVSDGINIPTNHRMEKSQLPLFQHEPSRIANRVAWWLRDVTSASNFALVDNDGGAYQTGASYKGGGVRPVFCIS